MSRTDRRTRRKGAGGSSSPVDVGRAISDLVEALGIGRTLTQYQVITGWGEIVGEQIAKVSTPSRIENGVLFVTVSTAPWRAELTLRRLEILGKIKRACGPDIVKEIRFR